MTADRSLTDARVSAVNRLNYGTGVLGLAGLFAIIGAIVGFAMALHATRIVCPNGTTVNGDGRCFAYHHAGVGFAIAIVCLVLLLVIVALVLLLRAASEAWNTPKPPTGVPVSELAAEITP